MKKLICTVVVAAGLAAGGTAPAQEKIAVIGATSVGAVPSMANSIAKVVSDKSGIQLRTQAMASETQYVPLVARGQMEFGISNIFTLDYAHKGTGIFEGRPHPDLRLAFTLMPFRNGVIVHKDSDIHSAEDLKGKRVPWGFKAQKKGLLLMQGVLDNFGIDESEIEPVPVASMPRMWDAFKRRNVDVAFVAMGAATVKEIAATVGGVRFIEFQDSPEAIDRMLRLLPNSFIATTRPQPLAGEQYSEFKTMFYDFTVWTDASVPEETVYKVVKTLYESPDELTGISPLWRRFKPEYMAKKQSVPFHAGSIRLFKEKGIWKDGM